MTKLSTLFLNNFVSCSGQHPDSTVINTSVTVLTSHVLVTGELEVVPIETKFGKNVSTVLSARDTGLAASLVLLD